MGHILLELFALLHEPVRVGLVGEDGRDAEHRLATKVFAERAQAQRGTVPLAEDVAHEMQQRRFPARSTRRIEKERFLVALVHAQARRDDLPEERDPLLVLIEKISQPVVERPRVTVAQGLRRRHGLGVVSHRRLGEEHTLGRERFQLLRLGVVHAVSHRDEVRLHRLVHDRNDGPQVRVRLTCLLEGDRVTVWAQ